MSKMGNDIQLIKVSENKRFLVKQDGTPFFWLGDTAWELFHKLNREEAELYLTNRAERKFTVIQAVALGEDEGLTKDNAYGRKPFKQNVHGQYDPAQPDTDGEYSYWDHVDYIVDRACELGLYIGFLPTWGDKFYVAWGKGPEVFNAVNARIYGKWLGERYKDRTNIIWVMGGDRPLQTADHFAIVNAMAQGIKEGDGGSHIMTLHPPGETSSSLHVHKEDWLDFNMVQSGHSALNYKNYDKVTEDYNRAPVKPVVDAEPRYEDHPINFRPENGYFDDFDVRQAAYWAVFAGAFGHTYGHHSIWFMVTEPGDYFIMNWKQALLRPGAAQMQHVRNLVESREFFVRIPNQNILAENYPGANHLQATQGVDFAFIYSPNGLKIKVVMGMITGEKVRAYWYDPRNGASSFIGEFENSGVAEFVPPSSGRNNDWVLVLDDASKNYPAPGLK